jgi:hypothetical protein
LSRALSICLPTKPVAPVSRTTLLI